MAAMMPHLDEPFHDDISLAASEEDYAAQRSPVFDLPSQVSSPGEVLFALVTVWHRPERSHPERSSAGLNGQRLTCVLLACSIPASDLSTVNPKQMIDRQAMCRGVRLASARYNGRMQVHG